MAGEFKELYSRGLSYEQSSDYENAIATYLGLIQEFPKFALSYYNLARLMDDQFLGAISMIAPFYKKFLDLTEGVNQLADQRQKAQNRYIEIQNYFPLVTGSDYLTEFDSSIPELNSENVRWDRPMLMSSEDHIRYDLDAERIFDWPYNNSNGNPLSINLSAKSGEINRTSPNLYSRIKPNSFIIFQIKINRVNKPEAPYRKGVLQLSTQGIQENIQGEIPKSCWQLYFLPKRNKIDSVSTYVADYEVGEDKADFDFYNADDWNIFEIHYNELRGVICIMNGRLLSSYSILSAARDININIGVMGMDVSIYPFLEE